MTGTVEHAAVLALTTASPREWYRTAAVIYDAGSAVGLLNGQFGLMPDARPGDATYAAGTHER